jgi:glycerophosphoryl diester phosphodiesterase
VATLRLAHRGDWRHAPENSLAALLAAVDVPGCDGVEFDVRASRDGVPVLCHDETLRRVHGVDARVDSLRWTELEQIGVVSLEDVLAAIPRRAFLDVELKDDPGRGAVEVLAAGRGPALERAVVSSFRPATLERVAGLAPTWPRWLNADVLDDATIATAVDLDCRAVSIKWQGLSDRAYRQARAAGLDVVAFTIRRRPTRARLERLGVAAICVEGRALDGPSDEQPEPGSASSA